MNRLEEILEHARDEDLYCIECFSADEVNECLKILEGHGWLTNSINADALFNGVSDLDGAPITCVALWFYGYDSSVRYSTAGYDDYQKWYEITFGEKDEEPDAVMRYSELFGDDKPDDIDSDDFDAFFHRCSDFYG